MKWRFWAVLALVAMIALAPSLAEARAGGSYRTSGSGSFSSMGSRGTQTYAPNSGAPIQRSVTPQTNPSAPYGAQPGYGGFGGYGNSHPFLTGLAGGFFGSWIGSMLFPHWGMGGGLGGFGGGMGFGGSILSWLLLAGGVWFLIRMFTRRHSVPSYGAPYGGPMPFAQPTYGAQPASFPAYGASRVSSFGVAASDYQQFEDILKGVQAAWSAGDLGALRRYATPEMLSYFSEQLAENQSQGVINHVENVELIKGEVRESWDEGALQYATALMHWRARDFNVRSDARPGEAELIVSGDPQNAVEAAELWTYARSPGGHWLLSAIQQVS